METVLIVIGILIGLFYLLAFVGIIGAGLKKQDGKLGDGEAIFYAIIIIGIVIVAASQCSH